MTTQPNNDPAMEAAKAISAELSEFRTGHGSDGMTLAQAAFIRKHYPLPPRDVIERAVMVLRDYRNESHNMHLRELADAALTSLRTLLAGETKEKHHSNAGESHATERIKTWCGKVTDTPAPTEPTDKEMLDWLLAGGSVLTPNGSGHYTSRLHYPVTRVAITAAMRNEQGGGS